MFWILKCKDWVDFKFGKPSDLANTPVLIYGSSETSTSQGLYMVLLILSPFPFSIWIMK